MATKKTAQRTKRQAIYARSQWVWPAVFIGLSVLLMILPLEGAIASIKGVLSYIFIPQIRAAHSTVEYSSDVSKTVRELLETHRENQLLKEQMIALQLENAQAREIKQENERLTQALSLRAPQGWTGVWAKTAYREPSQWNSVIIDKGTADGVRVRAAAVAAFQGKAILAGVVLEADERTAKVLLVQDEDFSAAVQTVPSQDEALVTGGGVADLKLHYLPLLSTVKAGDEVYTSPSSRIFPAGILVGQVREVERKEDFPASLSARVMPAVEATSVQELFILTQKEEEN